MQSIRLDTGEEIKKSEEMYPKEIHGLLRKLWQSSNKLSKNRA